MIFFLIWYLLCMLTYGTFVPSGLFVPGILMGCGLGQWFASFTEDVFDPDHLVNANLYAITCAGAILVSYTRLTFSIIAIMVETAQAVNLFMPITITIVISYWVAEVFNNSLYITAIGGKNIPMIMGDIPHDCIRI
jgi:chloride channel 7